MAIESFNEETQRAKVASMFKGGPFFQKPMVHPAMTFVDAVPAEVKAKQFAAKVPAIPVKDTK